MAIEVHTSQNKELGVIWSFLHIAWTKSFSSLVWSMAVAVKLKKWCAATSNTVEFPA